MKRAMMLLLSLFSAFGIVFADSTEEYYLSPKPGSTFNTMESTIIIREGSFIDPGCLYDLDVSIVGSESGEITGRFILSSDQKTVIFEPDRRFVQGEKVAVNLSGLRSQDGRGLPPCAFSFEVAPFAETPNPYTYIEELRPHKPSERLAVGKGTVQPEDFPHLTATINDTAAIGDGKVFLAVASTVDGIGYYLMVLNNDGSPFWYKKLVNDYAYDFKVQPSGFLTYAQFLEHHSYTGGGNVIHMVMDTTFTVVDSVQMKHGYVAEAHDFQLLPNGHVLLFGYYLTRVDMSQYVDGGHPAALVSGGVIQELDADRNVIFQWRSWDHYDFSEYSWGRRSKGATVSAFHLNTINLDKDGHFFLATPLWVKKINRQTGEIIWHLGGDENQFSFVGVDSTDGSSHFGGHAFYRLPSGNVLIYDNGNRQGTRSSKIHEYSIDENTLTATWVWTYEPDTKVAAWHRGNAQRLPNGNTVIGWGGASGDPIPTFSEVDATGNVVMELAFDNPDVESYRAFRFPLPATNTGVTVTEAELAVGNTYEFANDEDGDTGVSFKLNEMTGTGYNDVTVSTIPYAPLYPKFPGKAPSVMPVRVEMSSEGITTLTVDLSFNATTIGIENPETMQVYHRVFVGQGMFIPLATTYNPVTQELDVSVAALGEFIFAEPDLEDVSLSPMLVYPEADGTVNQELALTFFWNPRGFANSYDLQVATDDAFQTLVIDETGLTETRFTTDLLSDDTAHFWRVRTINGAGTSDWSDAAFTTVPPMVTVNSPNGGETWQRGLDYFVLWDDNLDENVVIELYKGGILSAILGTEPSIGAYEWEVGLALDTGDDYTVQIRSSVSEAVLDVSDAVFSIIDTVQTSVEEAGIPDRFELHQNYPNPFNPVTMIRYSISEAAYVTLIIYDLLGQEIETLVDGYREIGNHSKVWDASQLPTGVYIASLKAGSYEERMKMLFVK